jgi:serine/threonine protein kinase
MAELVLIGRGQSPIYRYRINQRNYALKVRLYDQGETNEDAMLMQLNHPGIVKCHAKFDAPDSIRQLVPGAWQVLVLEFIPGYPIRYLEDHPHFSVTMAIKLMTDLFDILGYLASHQIVHQDIHPNNLLYTTDHRLVLIDFEYAVIDSVQPKPKPNLDLIAAIQIGDQVASWIKVGAVTAFRRRLDRIRECRSINTIRRRWCQASM